MNNCKRPSLRAMPLAAAFALAGCSSGKAVDDGSTRPVTARSGTTGRPTATAGADTDQASEARSTGQTITVFSRVIDGTTRHFKRNCDSRRPGGAQCSSFSETDASGNTISEPEPVANSWGAPDLESAYDIPSFLNPDATVAIFVDGDYTNFASDNALYRSTYGLPPCTLQSGCLSKVAYDGTQNIPGPASSAAEHSLDVAMVTAACPLCKILLIVGNGGGVEQGAYTAASLGAVTYTTSFSWPEASGQASLNSYFDYPGFTAFAASGDNWNGEPTTDADGSSWPAYSTTVTAVGGTILIKDGSAPRGWDEVEWGAPGGSGFSGWGCSLYQSQPSWQEGVVTGCSARAASDVSAAAGPVAIVTDGSWVNDTGTSVAAPLVAGIYALTGNGNAGASYSYANPGLYNDVLSDSVGGGPATLGPCGGTSLCTVQAGWDGPTGNGSPNASEMLQPGISAFGLERFATGQGGSVGGPSSWVQLFYVPGSVALSGNFQGGMTYDGIAYVFPDGNNSVSVDLHQSNGTSLTDTRWATQMVPWEENAQWLAGDFNGDGATDIVETYSSATGNVAFHMLLSSGSSFVLSSWSTPSSGENLEGGGTFLAGQFLGNCTADLAYVFEDGDDQISVDVYESTGAGFIWSRWMTQVGIWPQGIATFGGNPVSWTVTPQRQWVAGDFNGDGHDDIVAAWDAPLSGQVGLAALYSRGPASSPTFSYEQLAAGQKAWNAAGWIVPMDVDGDGRKDIVYAWNDSGAITTDAVLSRSSSGSTRWIRLQTQSGSFQTGGWFVPGHFANGIAAPSLLTGELSDLALVFPYQGLTFDVHNNTGAPLELCGAGSCGAGISAAVPPSSACF